MLDVRLAKASELPSILDLRFRILREPHGQPRGSETDEWDNSPHTLQAVAVDGKAIIGIGRAHPIGGDIFQIRCMAVEPAYRGQGAGVEILKVLEEGVRLEGGVAIEVNARKSAKAFYKHSGYQEIGSAPTQFGVVEHVRMGKGLD